MKERIQRILEYYQISAAEFAKIIGVNASGISHILSGNRNHLSMDTVVKVNQKFPEINLDWLILGSGSMISARKQNTLFETETSGDLEVTKAEPKAQNIKLPKLPFQDITKKDTETKSLDTAFRKIVKIVVFYDDQSYQDFFP